MTPRAGGFPRAQLSLEYLLLLAACFAAFALLLPAAHNVYSSALFALDSKAAGLFAQQMQACVSEMRFLGDGSTMAVSARPLTAWLIQGDNDSLLVSVEAQGGSGRNFRVVFPNKISFNPERLGREKSFILEKRNGLIYLNTAS